MVCTELLLRRDSPRDAEVGGKHLLRDAQSAELSRDCTANVDGCVHDAPPDVATFAITSMGSSGSGIKGALVDAPRIKSTAPRHRIRSAQEPENLHGNS